MSTVPLAAHGDSQAQRLEAAVSRIASLVQQPANAQRLRAAPGAEEWSVLQTIGHCSEMIPYWLRQCRTLIDAGGPELPRFGRTLDDLGRLAGPASGVAGKPDELLAQLQSETRSGAAAIRALSGPQRAKQGVNRRGETVSVEDIVERFVVGHAEEHARQIEATLRGQT